MLIKLKLALFFNKMINMLLTLYDKEFYVLVHSLGAWHHHSQSMDLLFILIMNYLSTFALKII
jgi:hypothetical protein